MTDRLDGVDEVPVLLAGGGLVGLSTAMFLAQHGDDPARALSSALDRVLMK
jgi:glycine/D-amino acid oxidase-like deaminating enzyme